MNITYIAALLERANRPRFNNSASARAETARVLKRASSTMSRVARNLKRAGIAL